MSDATRTKVCRDMLRFLWQKLTVEDKYQLFAEVAYLPRGTGSDDGWLVVRCVD
jgi:hypothetical protein